MNRLKTFLAISALALVAVLAAAIRHKQKVGALAGDTAWVTVVLAGLSGKLQTAAAWLNGNVGTWSFVLGLAGFLASLYFRWRMARAAESGHMRLSDVAGE